MNMSLPLSTTVMLKADVCDFLDAQFSRLNRTAQRLRRREL
jgi:hypothetical protein